MLAAATLIAAAVLLAGGPRQLRQEWGPQKKTAAATASQNNECEAQVLRAHAIVLKRVRPEASVLAADIGRCEDGEAIGTLVQRLSCSAEGRDTWARAMEIDDAALSMVDAVILVHSNHEPHDPVASPFVGESRLCSHGPRLGFLPSPHGRHWRLPWYPVTPVFACVGRTQAMVARSG